MRQTYADTQVGPVEFKDLQENHHSRKCQPRDIRITSPQLLPHEIDRLRHDICADIRRSQGFPEVGLMKNAKH